MNPACRRRSPASPLVLARALLSAPGGTAHLTAVCAFIGRSRRGRRLQQGWELHDAGERLKPLQAKLPTSNNRLMFYLIWGENLHVYH